MDGGEEVAGGLVVACGDSSILLELGEEILNQVPRLVEMTIEGRCFLAVRTRWDDSGLSRGGQFLSHPLVRIEGLVPDQYICLHLRQKMIGALQVVRLTTGQMKSSGVAQRIDKGVDLGAQPAAGSPDRLVLASGFFFAPALC